MRRLTTAAAVLAAVLTVGACAPFQDKALRALVGEAAPTGDELSCEWGKSTYDGEPDAWVGCWEYLPGTPSHVANSVTMQLQGQGFDVIGERAAHMVALKATRNGRTVCVDVLERGAAAARNTAPAEIDPAPGEVFLDIWAERPASCAPLPDSPSP